MDKRPKIKIEYKAADKLMDAAGWILLIILWGLGVNNYANLPDTIPTHFNVLGKADGFGSKLAIFLLPIIGSIMFIGITFLNKLPHIFNYPVKITSENALKQYTIATRFIRYLKLVIILIFTLISAFTIYTANGASGGLGILILPLLLVLIFVPLVVTIIKMNKEK